jgi:hypothetical protein
LEDSVCYHCFEEKKTYYNEPIIQTPEKIQLKYILNISLLQSIRNPTEQMVILQRRRTLPTNAQAKHDQEALQDS